jgi:DNA repair protein RecN (Recombination protein N)
VLHELRVENLLLVERAVLRLGPGLNAITGETGAGKTMLARALDLLLGGRAGSGIVRAGASEAYVEGVFARPTTLEHPVLDRIPEEADELVLARRVWPDGRTRAYLCGRSVGVADLRDLGERLLSFYGQHEHRKLMLGAAQLDIVDRHCGIEALSLRDQVSELHARVRELEGERDSLAELAGARDRELDLLDFELREIEAAGPGEAEWEELTQQRSRLRHLDSLQVAASAGVEALDGEGGAGDALARALPALEGAAATDLALEPLLARMQSVRYEAEDIAAELRRYGSDIEAVPGQLEEVEERLALLSRLMRKYGGSLQAVLDHSERCRERRDELDRADARIEEVEAALEGARVDLTGAAARLTQLRRGAAPALADAVEARLAELAMAQADFEVHVLAREGGCGFRGADAVEMVIAPNPGMPAGPLREIASGGELSRVMLALLSVAHGEIAAESNGAGDACGADDDGPAVPERVQAPLLVFDEIDSGVGGHTARAVGEHLRQLAQGRQILCITHLPQVAALAERHFTIAKEGSALPARATVHQLEGDAVVAEVVRMLGASQDDRAAGRHARQLLRKAA